MVLGTPVTSSNLRILQGTPNPNCSPNLIE